MFCLKLSDSDSFLLIVWLLANVSLSEAYTATEVVGSYPKVLPQGGTSQAAGYDKHSNSILIFGGNDQQSAVRFNINTETFSEANGMVIGTSGTNYYTMVGDELWTINGAGNGFIIVDPATGDENVPSTEFPVNISPHGCLASHNDYLFVLGGWNDSKMQHIVQIYDIRNDKWIMDGPETQDSRSVCGCIVNNNRLYAVAGLQTNTIEYLDIGGDLNNIRSQQWHMLNDEVPDDVLRGLTVVNYGNSIIVLGGRTSTDTATADYPLTIPVIDTTSNTISIAGSLAYGVNEGACIIVGQRVYMFGGLDSSDSPVTSYQYIDLPGTVADSSMSGGSIFLLILFITLIVYCIGGYVFNGYKSRKWGDVKSNVPHLSFWKLVPLWTLAGCKVTYAFLRKKTGDEQMELMETGEADDQL